MNRNHTRYEKEEGMKGTQIIPALIGIITLGLVACQDTREGTMESPAREVTSAVAVLYPTLGNDTEGVIRFEKMDGIVRIYGDITGLTPGEHGFHIHEYGDCSAGDATSAGGHYAPRGMPHGAPADSLRHIGDLGNIEADANGTATINFSDSIIRLNGKHAIVGHALVVHGGSDDLESQPSGDAGSRVACGVIGVAPTE
jgi:Cu-Zn family superoxide dismutase